MTKTVCVASVHNDYGFGFHRCVRRASVMEDGKWWCRQHAPSFEQARREASERRYQAKRAVESLRDDVRALERVAGIVAREGFGPLGVWYDALLGRLGAELRDKESAL